MGEKSGLERSEFVVITIYWYVRMNSLSRFLLLDMEKASVKDAIVKKNQEIFYGKVIRSSSPILIFWSKYFLKLFHFHLYFTLSPYYVHHFPAEEEYVSTARYVQYGNLA